MFPRIVFVFCSKQMISYSLCITLCVATDVFVSYVFVLLSSY